MTQWIYENSRNAHLVLGSLALLTFWVQTFRRKGGKNHRFIGWAYLTAMIGVLVTSLPMVAIGLARGQLVTGFFLGFLTLITACALIESVLSSRNRASGAWLRSPTMKVVTTFLAIYSVVLVVLAFTTGFALLGMLGAVGILGTVEGIRKMSPTRPYRWWAEHIGATMASGIAVHIGFLSFGVRGLLGSTGFSIWLFVIPLVAGQLATMYFVRSFGGGRGKPGSLAGRASSELPLDASASAARRA